MQLTLTELKEKIANGEDSYTQFKKKLNTASDLADEVCAFANACGGWLFVGVEEIRSGGKLVENKISGIEDRDIAEMNGWIGALKDHLSPCPVVFSQIISCEGAKVLALEIPSGEDKPYQCKKNKRFWIRSGADKREMSSESVLRRSMERIPPLIEVSPVPRSKDADLNQALFMTFIEKKFSKSLSEFLSERKVSEKKLMQNMNLVTESEELTIAGAMLYAHETTLLLPTFHIKAVHYAGKEIAGSDFIDRNNIEGNLSAQFHNAMNFLSRNLRKLQATESFNSQGRLEINSEALEEHLVNALVHRNYGIEAPIRLFIFADRVELLSPGCLPNNQTVEALKIGAANAIPRNPIIVSHASYILPYSGVGSGIVRALSKHPETDFESDPINETFKVILHRPGISKQS